MSPDFGHLTRTDRTAWFRRHAPLAPARACELRVGRQGRILVASPEGSALRLRPLAARFRPAASGNLEPRGMLFPIGPSTVPPLARLPSRWSALRVRPPPPRHALSRYRNFGSVHPGFPFMPPPRLHAASASGSTVLGPSLEPAAVLAHRLGFATCLCWHPFVPVRLVSRRHLCRSSPVSCWSRFGFPLPDRLLTVMKVSSNPIRAKLQIGVWPC